MEAISTLTEIVGKCNCGSDHYSVLTFPHQELRVHDIEVYAKCIAGRNDTFHAQDISA